MALVKAVSASEGMASVGAGGVEGAAGGDVVAVIRAPAEVVTTALAPGGALVEGGTPGAVVSEEAMIMWLLGIKGDGLGSKERRRLMA